jgi:hypothetical protein
MSAQFRPDTIIRCTFGFYTQTGPWDDRREMTWADLAIRLTQHEVGSKEGTCWVPATFRGTVRRKEDSERIEVAVLDCDAGHSLEEICASITARGWAAIVASTYSHGTTETRVTRRQWDEAIRAADNPDRAATDLLLSKSYLSSVSQGARVVREDGAYVVIKHEPCPKFRIVIPLKAPWEVGELGNQADANAQWKLAIERLAADLGLAHDQACTDTSRLFYLPRRPADGPAPEFAVLEGEACDLFSLPPPPANSNDRAGHRRGTNILPARDRLTFVEPETGEVVDLAAWARSYASRFEIVKAIEARCPGILTGKVADGTKYHLRCVNSDAHTDSRPDQATFIVNASESTSMGFVYHCCHAHCINEDRLLFVRRMLEQGALKVADLTDPSFLTPEARDRPVIRLEGGDLDLIVEQAEAALIAADLGLYQRGSTMVCVGNHSATVPAGRRSSECQISIVEHYFLAERLTKAAIWLKHDRRSKKDIRVDAPLQVAMTLLQMKSSWRFPVLTGVITAPTLRLDGSILSDPGYDHATGLLLDTAGVAIPPLPHMPSREEAVAALRVLQGLLDDFPFVSDADHSAALAGLLTSCVRFTLPTAPLFACSAPQSGTGKSLLTDLMAVLATGKPASPLILSESESETEKRLVGALLAGQPVICFDNCTAPVGGAFLCSALTQTTVRGRVLQLSKVPEMLTFALFMANGNNLVLGQDMARRTIAARLNAQHERPEQRNFEFDLLKEVMDHRPRYVAACLTLMRAYITAGRPIKVPAFNSFDDWNSLVRGSLLWLGLADPLAPVTEFREAEPELEMLRALFSAWWTAIGNDAVSAQRLKEVAILSTPSTGAQHHSADLREALVALMGEETNPSSVKIGIRLARFKDRIVDGFQLRCLPGRSKTKLWRLDSIEEQRAAA